MLQQLIFGIKVNGVSFKIDTLNIESDQTIYNYICNVILVDSFNGNGSYDVTIVNNNLIPGCPIGKWKILSASIKFDWGTSYAWFILVDEKGQETRRILTSSQRGSNYGFSVEYLTRSIFPKAQQIVSEFPSASIYNAYNEFNESKPDPDRLKRYLEKTEADDCIEYFIDNTLDKMRDYLINYKKFTSLLIESEDLRSKSLLIKATEECQKVITYFGS